VRVLAAHAIGIDDVIDLTDAELISWGIASADRKRLLEAITALRQSQVGAPASAPDHQTSAGVMARGAERRQVSVLFCTWSVRPRLPIASILKNWRLSWSGTTRPHPTRKPLGHLIARRCDIDSTVTPP
jgi:hypothetical protein